MSLQTLIEFIDNWRVSNGVATTEAQRIQLATALQAQVATFSASSSNPLARPVFYSGSIGTIQAWTLVQQLTDPSNGARYFINQTQAGQITLTDDLRSALVRATGSNAVANAMIKGRESSSGRSPFGVGNVLSVVDFNSQRMAQAAFGDVLVVSVSVQADKVFAATELPALIANERVTHINGVPRQVFTQLISTMSPDEAGVAIRDIIRGSSLIRQGQEFVNLGGERVSLLELSRVQIGGTGIREILKSATKAFTHNSLQVLGTLGAVAGLVTMFSAFYEASNEVKEGRWAEASLVMGEWSGRFLGSLGAGLASAELAGNAAAPLLAAGPLGEAGWAILTAAAGIAGGIFGDQIIARLFSPSAPEPYWNFRESVELALQDDSVGLAYRHVLRDLNPLALLMGEAPGEGELALYDPATGDGEITRQWIETRSGVLMHYVRYWGRAETDGVLSLPLGVPYGVSGDVVISDAGLGAANSLTIDGFDFGAVEPRYVRFGDETSNVLTGGTRNDFLFGERGNDFLTGGTDGGPAEQDYLEGGLGDDTYIYQRGDGQDTIVDVGGDDRIVINGAALAGTFERTTDPHHPGALSWSRDQSGGTVVLTLLDGTLDGGTLLVSGSALGDQGRISLENFSNGRFGLNLDPGNKVKSITGRSNLAENTANVIRIVLAVPAEMGQRLRLSVDPLVGGLVRLSEGGQILDFAPDGTINIDLADGQSTYTYLLLSDSDVDEDASFAMSAVLLDGNELPIEASRASLSIALDALDESEILVPVTNFLRVGTNSGEVLFQQTDTPGDYHVQGLGGDDLIDASAINRGTNDPLGNDLLDGGDGNDKIYAWAGNDRLLGGLGNDDLRGEDGDDVIEGGAGSDFGFGGAGRNWLFADSEISVDAAIAAGDIAISETGQGDWLQDAEGDAVIIGSNRQDMLGGGGGSDRLVGGGGDDVISGDGGYTIGLVNGLPPELRNMQWSATLTIPGAGGQSHDFAISASVPEGTVPLTNLLSVPGSADVIYAGTGNDAVFAGGGDDLIDAGTGGDLVYGDGGNDTILGQAGDDVLIGDGDASEPDGADFIDGGDDNDRIHGGDGADVLYGGAGNDVITSDSTELGAGEDYVNGEGGDDQLWGDAKSDTLIGGAGNDQLFGDSQQTTIANSGDDFLDGGEGDDLLVGAGGQDTLIGGAGADQLIGHGSGGATDDASADYLDGGAGNDSLWGWGGDDQLLGGDGDDQLVGDEGTLAAALHGDDEIDGGAGTDTLFGLGGNDALLGGAGDDLILGGDGDDLVVGGTGVDYLRGEAGDDTYVFEAADIAIVGATADAVDDSQGRTRLLVNGGLTSQDVVVALGASANSINLSSSDGLLGVVIKNGLSGGLDSIVFADRIEMSAAQLIGSRLNSNADQVSDASDTSLYGGSQSDTIFSTGTNVSISGGRGDDLLGSSSGSSNTYVFARGDGRDSVNDRSQFATTSGLAVNALALGDAIWLEDISIKVLVGGAGATLDFGNGDSIAITDFSINDPVNGLRTFDEVQLADGAILDWQQLLTERGIRLTNTSAATSFSGTQLDDYITGAAQGESIDAGAGDDTLDGGAGNDILSGGTGSDIYLFKRGAGGDTINNGDTAAGKLDVLEIASDIFVGEVDFFKVGTSLLVQLRNTTDQVTVNNFFTDAGLDAIVFIDGTVFTAATVPWEDPPGNWFNYQRGDGSRSYTVNDPSDSILDALRFGANVDPASVRLSATANGDLLIQFREPNGSLNSNDRITFFGAVASGAAALNQIVFDADPAAVWTTADQLALARIPTSGNDFIYGSAAGETLAGLAGVDVIRADAGNDAVDGGLGNDDVYGGDGDDLLRGGKGADRLYGDAGSDTFRVERGDASDTVMDRDTNAASIDRIEFGAGILPQDVRVTRSSNNMVLTYFDAVSGSAINSVTVTNYYAAGYEGQTVDEVRFVDAPGIVWQSADLLLARLQGGAQNDGLAGHDTNDVMRGMGGDDVLSGLLGNDDLDGGTGNDTLAGGQGDDTYRFGLNGGSDTIMESSGTDRILLDGGISTSDVQLFRQSGTVNGELVLVVNGSQHQLRVWDAFNASGNNAIESIEFASGTVWNAAEIAARTAAMGAFDSQTGTAAGDVFIVDNVNDLISESPSGGVDSVQSSVTYLLPTNVENLTLTGVVNTSGNGNELANVIVGNAGANSLNGGAGVDTMIGGLGDDTYVVDDAGGSSFGDGWSDGSQDVVQENVGEGFDTVVVNAYSETLAPNVERLVAQMFTGNFGSFPGGADRRRHLHGNELNNVIDATALVDGTYNNNGIYLDGGLGADIMLGGETDETYVVDDAGDVVAERGINALGAQTSVDLVISSVNFTLSDNVENLNLVGASAISGTGNELNNLIDGTGNSAANVLAGGDGDDTYRVGVGDTAVEGADAGTDTVYIVGPLGSYSTANYTNVETIELDNVAGDSSVLGDGAHNRIIGNGGANLLQGGAGSDVITDGRTRSTSWFGQDGDTLQGGDGDDTLYTNYGADTLDGGAGNDLLVEQSFGDSRTITTYVFGRGYGQDTISSTASIWASSEINLLAGVSESDVTLTRSGADLLLNIAGDPGSLRVLSFFTDATGFTVRQGMVQNVDFADGTSWDRTRMVNLVRASSSAGPTTGDDVLLGTSADDVIDALAGNDVVYGTGGNDTVTGNDGVDELWGEAGNDILVGGTGNDSLRGGAGADSYRFASASGSDVINDSGTAAEDASVDEVVFEAGIAPGDIQLRFGPNAPAEPDLLIRNTVTGDEILVRNHFRAEAGMGAGDHIEQIRFADGTVWNAAEILSRATQIVGTEGDDVLQAIGSLSTQLFGLGGDDGLIGQGGNDVLDGGSGADEMAGGTGDDTYEVDSAGDMVFEEPGEGTDLVRSSIGYTLGADVENLILLGSSAINGTGNSLANVITGNAGNNVLNGGTGADKLFGGAGDDTYDIDNPGDEITENPGEGTDLVRSTLTHALAADVENLTLTGSSAINATGNDLVNILLGNSGANVINGGAGADDMSGGAGNDTFVVDNVGDIVRENSGQGTDTIQSSITLTTLAANVEHVTLTGTANINAVGGSGNNTLTGNSGNNVLDGGAGTDTLIGGIGDDTYIVNSTTDTITELAGGGTDTVQSNVSFSINTTALQNVIENLTLTGTTANTTATGNALANVLTGTSAVNTLTGNDGNDTLTGLGGNDTLNGGNGNDVLDGGTGNDTMTGGAGDDSFFVDSTTDVVTEASGGGTDTMHTSVQRTSWSANVENMTFLGTGNLNTPTTTSSANNVLIGNSGNNTLNGGAGSDTLNGAGGTDSLVGGTGADTYQYNAGGGTDTIDNVAADSLIDRLQFLDLASDQITFSRSGNNLVMTRVGVSTDRVTVTNWFTATANRLDFVNFTNVEKTAAQIDALIAGGGGSFLMSASPPAAMRATRLLELGADFEAWGAWNGGRVDETSNVELELPAKAQPDEAMIWRPIKSFTLGEKSAADVQQAVKWRPIKSFARDELSVGVDRLIDAMTTFGVERNADSANQVDHSQSDALNSLAAHHPGRSQLIRAAFHAALD